MLVVQVFFKDDNHAFHLYLQVDKLGDNKILSTVPVSLLQKLFPNLMATIKYAHIPSPFAGDRYLQMLASRILSCNELYKYFYPKYLLERGRVTLEQAEQIISLQHELNMYPRCYYSEKTDTVQFFVLSQMYCRQKRHILKTAQFITKDDFEFNYVLNKAMELEFEQLNNCLFLYLELEEEGQIEYALALNENKELMMLVSL